MALPPEWGDRIITWRQELSNNFYCRLNPITFQIDLTREQFSLGQALKVLRFEPASPGTHWGEKWEYAWFKDYLTLPDAAAGQIIALMLDVGAELSVYINGQYAGAIDEKHTVIHLTDDAFPLWLKQARSAVC